MAVKAKETFAQSSMYQVSAADKTIQENKCSLPLPKTIPVTPSCIVPLVSHSSLLSCPLMACPGIPRVCPEVKSVYSLHWPSSNNVA
eukprot:scaffold94671_cov53-Cyclotella_meneghiniana.AAC.5